MKPPDKRLKTRLHRAESRLASVGRQKRRQRIRTEQKRVVRLFNSIVEGLVSRDGKGK